MSNRFFAPFPFDQQTVWLAGSEAHHLRTVLRLPVGGEVILFDGEGTEARAEIVGVNKSEVELRVVETHRDEADDTARIFLATSVPKGERFRWLVEKSVELGVERLIPLNTARSVVEPRETRLEKMRALVIAACKQSRRNRLMQIAPAASWTEFLAWCTCGQKGRTGSGGGPQSVLIADPSGEPIVRGGAQLAGKTSRQEIVLVVGPEGGFTTEELSQAKEIGARVVSLGRQILRVETAAIALASLYSCGVELSPK